MTLRVYERNGRPAMNGENDYRFSNLLRDLFGEDYYRSDVNSTPAVNIIENKEFFELKIALPGYSKNDVLVNVEKNVLTVSRREHEEANETDKYSRKEFDFSNFKRSFNLPKSVDTQSIKAKMDNGILSVKLPKKEEAIDRGPKEISIS